MKLTTLVFGVLWMLLILLSEIHVCASALKQLTQLPTQEENVNKKDQEFTMEVMKSSSVHSEGDTLAKFEDHANIPQHKKFTRRTLSRKHVSEGKKGRWLAVDEVDYAGPRTHPPTKPPRK